MVRKYASVLMAQLLLVMTFASAVVADTNSCSSSWSVYHGNFQRNGAVSDGCGIEKERFAKIWEFPTNGKIQSTPLYYLPDSNGYAYQTGLVIFVSTDGYLYCADDEGNRVWSKHVGQGVKGNPLIWNDRVYLASGKMIYAFDVWTGELTDKIETNLTINTLVIIPERNYMYFSGLDSDNNNVLKCIRNPLVEKMVTWYKPLEGTICGELGYRSGYLYLTAGGYLYCISYRSGSVVWRKSLNCPDGADVAITGSRVYVGSKNNRLICLDAFSGEQLWSQQTSVPVVTSIASYGDYVFAAHSKSASVSGNLQGLYASSGALSWTYADKNKGYFSGSPIIYDDKVYIASEGKSDSSPGVIYCLRARDGKLLWHIENTSGFISPPAMAGNKLFIGGADGKLYCFGTGTVLLDFQLGQRFYTSDSGSYKIDAEPVVSQGRTLLPARYVVEPLGGWVKWDAAERKVTSKLNDEVTIEFWIGKNKARVNGVMMIIDEKNPGVVPSIINDRTMVPMRFLGESAGCDVDWMRKRKR